MDAQDVDEAMAQLRLRAALVEHIEERETPPAELSEAVRAMFRIQPPSTA